MIILYIINFLIIYLIISLFNIMEYIDNNFNYLIYLLMLSIMNYYQFLIIALPLSYDTSLLLVND